MTEDFNSNMTSDDTIKAVHADPRSPQGKIMISYERFREFWIKFNERPIKVSLGDLDDMKGIREAYSLFVFIEKAQSSDEELGGKGK